VYEKIYKENLSDIDISVLINNAGYAQVGYFNELSEQDVHTQLTCNTYPVILLTQQLLRSFKSRYTRFGKRSLLATTSSIAGHYPIPLLGVYSASKKFVDSFSWAMVAELGGYGVDVCAWQAGTVTTKLNDYTSDALASTPDVYA